MFKGLVVSGSGIKAYVGSRIRGLVSCLQDYSQCHSNYCYGWYCYYYY